MSIVPCPMSNLSRASLPYPFTSLPPGTGVERIQPILEQRIHCRKIRAITHGCRSREIRGNLLRDLAGSSPFRSALERDHEVNGTETIDIVAERRVEDAPLSVAERHQHRLIPTGSTVGRVGVRRTEDGHVFPG